MVQRMSLFDYLERLSMNEHPILGQVVLGYCPMIDRQRTVTATRLTVFPLRPDLVLDAAALLLALAEAWPAEGKEPLLLNLASEALLHDSLAGAPPLNLMLEVPAFMAADPQHEAALTALHATRQPRCYLKGRPGSELPRERAALLQARDRRPGRRPARRATPRAARRAAWARAVGRDPRLRGRGKLQPRRGRGAGLADRRGACGKGSGKTVAPDLKVIVELMNRVDREEPIDRLEAVLKQRPDAGLQADALHQFGRPSACASRSARSATRS